MKKVFAVMSTMLLALACFGLLSNSIVGAAEPAEGKFVVDPTLAEDEIPVYIMGSIYTTFPHYYDNEAQADPEYGGAARRYPWNETTLRIAQYDNATGQKTGKYYSMYFAGALKSNDDSTGDPINGAGRNILLYAKDPNTNQIVLARKDVGTLTYKRNAMDPSLSHMTKNIVTDTDGNLIDIEVDMNELFAAVGDGADPNRMYNRVLVFDAEGRIIRGSGADSLFAKPGSEGASSVQFAPEYCYVDGKIVKYVEGVTDPDKVQTAQVDTEGNPVLDAQGNPVMVDTDEDHFLYQRFTFEWFAEEPTNVNEVGYLDAGWDPHKWDYCYEQDGGYMCIAFTRSQGSNVLLTDEQLAAYNATLKAEYVAENGSEDGFVPKTTADAIRRECVAKFRIPAGGGTYDLGYLDNQNAFVANTFNEIFISAYRYGRNTGNAEQRTHEFSSSELTVRNVVRNETSYRVMDSNNTIEIIKGSAGQSFKPADSIIYTGLTNYWAVPNDTSSYSANASSCEFTMVVNGQTVVQPSAYTSFEQVVCDWQKDFNDWQQENNTPILQANLAANPASAEWLTSIEWSEASTGENANLVGVIDKSVALNAQIEAYNSQVGEYNKTASAASQMTALKLYIEYPDASWIASNGTNPLYVSKWRNLINWQIVSTSAREGLITKEGHWEKWSWMYAYISANSGKTNVQLNQNGSVASPGMFTLELYSFFTETQNYYSATGTSKDWSNGAARGWMPEKTNAEDFADYTIDASEAELNTTYSVQYTVRNTVTGKQSSITVNYVVTDSYTPFIELNLDALNIPSAVVEGRVVVNGGKPVTAYDLLTAYDGKYYANTGDNEVDMKGRDITWKVRLSSDTLDLNAPTEGTHRVTAEVRGTSEKFDLVQFTVTVRDRTAPVVQAAIETINVPYGSHFDPIVGITIASDNVDGNLFDYVGQYELFVDSSRTPVDTTKPGNYRVTMDVYDTAGNVTQVSYDVVVHAAPATLDELGEVAEEVEYISGSLLDEVTSIQDFITSLQEELTAKGCKKKSAAFVVQLLSVSSLLVLVLRKKH